MKLIITNKTDAENLWFLYILDKPHFWCDDFDIAYILGMSPKRYVDMLYPINEYIYLPNDNTRFFTSIEAAEKAFAIVEPLVTMASLLRR